jgi:hypothetical protein
VLPKTRGGGRDAGASGPSSSNGSGIYVGHHAHGSRGPQRATIDSKAIVAADHYTTVVSPVSRETTRTRGVRLPRAGERKAARRGTIVAPLRPIAGARYSRIDLLKNCICAVLPEVSWHSSHKSTTWFEATPGVIDGGIEIFRVGGGACVSFTARPGRARLSLQQLATIAVPRVPQSPAWIIT